MSSSQRKAIWAAAKDAEVEEKVWTASIMARKSQAEMVICCGGGTNILGLVDYVRVGGTGV